MPGAESSLGPYQAFFASFLATVSDRPRSTASCVRSSSQRSWICRRVSLETYAPWIASEPAGMWPSTIAWNIA